MSGASAKGDKGQTLTISKAALSDGDTVTVSGTGYDTAKGVYVALCRDLGPGRNPTPCGGGADTAGQSGGSQWISSNPPPYGRDLAVKYGDGGTFTVKLSVKAKISDTVDCAKVKCAIVTRADHTRSADRSQDVRVPVEFGGGSSKTALIAGGAAVTLVLLVALAFVLVRRRGAASE
ncbi:hypothetical protein [Actinocorallia longicatena]|uniref:Neocarzinostatin family protein n=1 Tax=Actinocorallia longicatena TaxID=111803 RepID=A0ABP6Q8N6_9ACTN